MNYRVVFSSCQWFYMTLKPDLLYLLLYYKYVIYNTDREIALRDSLIAEIKANSHPSLKDFKDPTIHFITENYRIRIDRLINGKYRYASWKIPKNESEEPDLIIKNGELIASGGSGGGIHIRFTNGKYKYECSWGGVRQKSSPDGYLIVYKGEKEILSEEFVKIYEY